MATPPKQHKAALKPKLKSVEEVKALEQERRQQLDITREFPPLEPPVPGAFCYTCQTGENVGKRYWALKTITNGKYSSTFLGWIDQPVLNMKDRMQKQEEQIQELKKQIASFKKKAKKAVEESDDSDDDLSQKVSE
jgi:hypothetical protein